MHSQNRLQARGWTFFLGLFCLTALGGCDLLDVTNPGQILDEDLDIPGAMPSILVGISSDYSVHLDEWAFLVARASDEMDLIFLPSRRLYFLMNSSTSSGTSSLRSRRGGSWMLRTFSR